MVYGMFTLGQRPRAIHWLFRFCRSSTTTTEAINREPQRMAVVKTATPTPTDHSTAYPDGAPETKLWRPQVLFFPHQLDRPNTTRTKRLTQKQRIRLQTSIATPPLLFRALQVPSHPRDPESHGCLACTAENIKRAAAAART